MKPSYVEGDLSYLRLVQFYALGDVDARTPCCRHKLVLPFKIEAFVNLLLGRLAIFEINDSIIESMVFLKHTCAARKLDASVTPVRLLDEVRVKFGGSQRVD